MVNKYKIAGSLMGLMDKRLISLNAAIKLYGKVDKHLARNLNSGHRATRAEILKHLINATAKGNHNAWTSALFPAEMLFAYNVYPLTLEVMAGIFATLGLAPPFLEKSDGDDVPNTMCSFHRLLMGMSGTDFMSRPLCVAATSLMCDGNLHSFRTAAENKNAPFIYLDVPYEMSDAAVAYVKEQLTGIVKMFEELTGVKLGDEGLRRVAMNANKAFQKHRELCTKLANIGITSYRGCDLASFAYACHFLLGSEMLLDIIDMRSEATRSVPVKGKRLKRIMWLHITPQYDTEFWSIIDNGKDTKFVCDEYSTLTFEDYDLSDPLTSIAKRLISHPSNGPVERRIDNILRVAKDFKIDGMVHLYSWGCHQSSGNIQILENAISNAGYKFINLNGDPVDIRNATPGQHRTRLEAFLEN